MNRFGAIRAERSVAVPTVSSRARTLTDMVKRVHIVRDLQGRDQLRGAISDKVLIPPAFSMDGPQIADIMKRRPIEVQVRRQDSLSVYQPSAILCALPIEVCSHD